jgi:hypothetical protein
MIITPKIAIDWIREKEPIAASMNFHLGLTGSVLFKGESIKDFDVIAYPHNPHNPTDKAALLKAMGLTLAEDNQRRFAMYADKTYGSNVAICSTESGLRVDVLFMQ